MDEELGDERWELIALLLPKHKRRGRPRLENLLPNMAISLLIRQLAEIGH